MSSPDPSGGREFAPVPYRRLEWLVWLGVAVVFSVPVVSAFLVVTADLPTRAPLPLAWLAGGLVLLGFGAWLRFRALGRRRAGPEAVATVVLVFVIFVVAFLPGEWLIRSWLSESQGFGLRGAMQRQREAGGVPLGPYSLLRIVQLSSNPRTVYELRPNAKTQFGKVDVEINGEGMREVRSYSPSRPPGATRIVGIGDSGMFGWDVEQGGDYLSVLEERLNGDQNEAEFEVLNLAVPGYNTAQEVETLRTRGLAYDPQIVILGWCVNDLYPPSLLYEDRSFDELDRSYLWNFLFDRPAFSAAVVPDLREDAALQLELREHEEGLDAVAGSRLGPALRGQVGWPGVERSFRELRELSGEGGFRVLVFGPLGDEVRALCLRTGLDCYDTLLEIDPTKERGKRIHRPHPTAAGHAALAGYLEEALRERGWLRGPEPGVNRSEQESTPRRPTDG